MSPIPSLLALFLAFAISASSLALKSRAGDSITANCRHDFAYTFDNVSFEWYSTKPRLHISGPLSYVSSALMMVRENSQITQSGKMKSLTNSTVPRRKPHSVSKRRLPSLTPLIMVTVLVVKGNYQSCIYSEENVQRLRYAFEAGHQVASGGWR
jgi:hypothetical protein